VNPVAAIDPFIPHPHIVRRVRRDTDDIITLEMVPTSGIRPDYSPGQFNMLYLFGAGEVPISVSGDPAIPGSYVHTVRNVGAVTGAIARLKVNAVVGVRGPFGTAWPCAEAEGNDVVLIAGGLGLAPLRPAIYRILANRPRYGRVAVLYGARGPRDILYRKEIERWRRRLDVDVAITVDRADPGWRGNVGVVTKLLQHISFDPLQTVAMVCGPEIMMRFTASVLNEAGVALDRIYLSMERNMKCAIGLCGHCQFGPDFICKDGPVMRYDRIVRALAVRGI
jgi:NAD(P)H-flavin reductase